jgi:hypothetical protein
VGIFYHIQKLRIQVRLTLEIKNQVKQVLMNIVNGLGKEIFLQHTGWSSKLPQPARALGATQVTTGGRLKTDADGVSPLYWPAANFAELVAAPHFQRIHQAPRCKLTNKVNGIVQVKIQTGLFVN